MVFELGGTLVEYWGRSRFHRILKQAITNVRTTLDDEGLLRVCEEKTWRRVRKEDREAPGPPRQPLDAARAVREDATNPRFLFSAVSASSAVRLLRSRGSKQGGSGRRRVSGTRRVTHGTQEARWRGR